MWPGGSPALACMLIAIRESLEVDMLKLGQPSWTSNTVDHRRTKAAAVGRSEGRQCCQELRWAATGLLIWAGIYHSATTQPNEGNIPATGCSLAPHTQTLDVSISMLRYGELLLWSVFVIGPDEPEALKVPASLYSFVAILKRPFNYTTLRKSSLFVRK